MKKLLLAFFFTLFIAGFSFAQFADPSKDWTISLQLWTFKNFDFFDAVAKADSCGIKYLQAIPGQKLGGPWQGSFGPQMNTPQREQVKEYLRRKGQTFIGYGVVNAEDEAEWRTLFLFAKEMGIPIIIAEPTKDQWDYVDRLAGEFHIPVAIHDHPKPAHYWSPDSVIAAMKGHPNIGACADVGHWARNGLNPVECLKKLQGHILNVHLKDIVTFGKTDAEDTIPGKGVIDFYSIFKELKRQNYKGSFSIEHESNWEHNAGDVIEIVHFYYDTLKKI